MKKAIISIFLVSSLFLGSCEILTQILQSAGSIVLTEAEVVEGLKKALSIGAESSSTILHKQNGYFKDKAVKIFLPKEANVIIDNISKIPGVGQKTVDDVILSINRSAEDAASQAKPIFIDAIKSMTVTDGMNILRGKSNYSQSFDSTAATMYLKDKTYGKLKAAFAPKINTSLNKKLVGNVSTNKAWGTMVNYYNKVAPFLGKPKITTNLGAFVTERALDGLFLKVGEEERKIRRNPLGYASEIIKKVFSNIN